MDGICSRTRISRPWPSSGPTRWRVSGLCPLSGGLSWDSWGLVRQGAHCTQSSVQAKQAGGCAGCEWHLHRRPVQLPAMLYFSAQPRLLQNHISGSLEGSPPLLLLPPCYGGENRGPECGWLELTQLRAGKGLRTKHARISTGARLWPVAPG